MYFFQSFRNSLLPKQLLRFVLARLDLLDSQALDLDNLNFAIGRNTVLEFRDVGLILSKLEALAKLPPTFKIQKAKVLLLRITIPVDVYNSPIIVEVEGVDARVRVASKQEQDEQTPKNGEEVVPTAADLAQFFLQTAVPTDEQRRLEKALAEEAQEALSESMTDSETDDDGSFATFGTGQGLSLPTFLTNFLQGILDRVQIRIHKVTFQLDMQVPVEPGLSTTELVTFQLALDQVIAEGVTAPGQQQRDSSPAIVPREGKRHILLDNLRAFLITEANVFSSLLPTQSAQSLVKSQGSAPHDVPSTLGDMSGSMQSSVGGLDMSISPDQVEALDMLAQSQYSVRDSEDALNIPYEDDIQHPEGQENVDGSSPLSTPRASIYQEHDTPILQDHANSAVMQHQPELWSSYERGIRSEPSLCPPTSFQPPNMPSGAVSPASSEPLSSASSVRSDDDLPSADVEDLAQSHLYSHEEAESMYMSAFSDARSTMMPGGNMPGGWDSESSGGDESATERDSSTTHPPPVAGEPQSSPSVDSELAGLQPTPESTQGDEPHHEDASTPRGITRMVKEIVSLDSISVYVPSTRKQVPVPVTNLAKSNPNLPGAFSVYQSFHSSTTDQLKLLTPEDPEEEDRRDESIEVVLKPLTLRFDSSVGFLLAMVVTRLLEAFQGSSEEATKAEPSKDDSGIPDIKVILEQVTVQFLEKLAGVADSAKRIYETQKPDFGSDVLLEASLTNFNASAQKSGSQTEVNVGIEKFTFGYADEAIISFTGEADLFQSTATVDMLSAGKDIAVRATITSDVTRVDVKTLPLYMKLDLQRLDETFSWFGGLSSFLNMGSSEDSVAKAVQKPAKPPQKTRGVRFEAPIDPMEKRSGSKIDVRINGVHVDVIGNDCSAVLNTSALKLVHREEAIAAVLKTIRLSGPHVRNSHAKAPVVLELDSTRLDYIVTPRTRDLERLLELITPSKVKFDEDEDEIMVDTLLRQRRKGAVLGLDVKNVKVRAGNLALLDCIPSLVEDLAKLGTVAKYLPEDDRPGLLTLGQVTNVDCEVDVGGRFGVVNARLTNLELAQITVPSLVAVAAGGITVNRNEKTPIEEELVSTSTAHAPGTSKAPVLMMRMIDDIEPVLKIKLFGLNVDYRVPTIMDVLGLVQEDTTPEEFEANLAASVANLGGQATAALRRQDTPESPVVEKEFKPIKLDVAFRDCVIGLNPLGQPSKLAIVLADSHLEAIPGKDSTLDATATLKKACILLVDDVKTLQDIQINARGRAPAMSTPQALELCSKGFVSICEISSAKAVVKVGKDDDGESHVEVSVRDDLLVLETCADSTQTLISLANALTPPTPPSKEIKYRTSVLPVEDLFASITHDAFGRAEGEYDFDNDFAGAQGIEYGNEDDDDYYGIGSTEHLEVQSEGYGVAEELFDATNSSILGDIEVENTNDGMLVSTANLDEPPASSQSESDLDIQENYFSSEPVKNTRLRWNSRKNLYDQSSDAKVSKSPLVICVRDVHVIWNLYDGYDWVRTREIITKAVQDVEAKAYERKARADRHTYEDEGDEASVVDDCLFNSIYIAVGPNGDPSNLRRAINQELQYQDTTTETESIATTAFTTSTARASGHRQSRPRSKTLKLSRSKNHKITFELKGVNVDVVTFPPGNETINTIDVRIHDLDVFDHIRTSTWKKFAMYDIDAGERELSKHMVHLEVLNVKPVPDLPATELVVKVNILPLRLHVDQDALDFITRFFEFKDETQPIHQSSSDVPFIQRCEVGDVPVRLDFKPKRVDYAGLRSGHTTEFMNFVILEDSRLVLRHVILYGVSGFDKLGKKLNDIWTADVKATQLPGVLAGVAPVRSLVNAGSGFKDLIEIPIREYKKDGRIFRSIGKGATAFAKTTGTEVVKLGAKLAIGTQYALQGAEGMLAKSPPNYNHAGPSSSSAVVPAGVDHEVWDEEDFGDDRHTPKAISLYADQPLGIMQGMRGAYASLSRDIAIARDAIIAVPTEVMESSSAQGAAKAVLMQAPTILFRPAIGVSKAIGQTLLGATNALDPNHRRRIEAVSLSFLLLPCELGDKMLTMMCDNRNTRSTKRKERQRASLSMSKTIIVDRYAE
ncbi:hypothetical protein B0H65DRAFT_418528 [Neurospora tetraspora]|uniref:Autophagy-related protein 2 n=1 Tax=Neurospora tetraspora TaxID=94610 RepID=A0AAE0MVF2_9PEZI|nr:hypothetical protein B0H65DRAFT_418528 [Neurospora tetraspora]